MQTLCQQYQPWTLGDKTVHFYILYFAIVIAFRLSFEDNLSAQICLCPQLLVMTHDYQLSSHA